MNHDVRMGNIFGMVPQKSKQVLRVTTGTVDKQLLSVVLTLLGVGLLAISSAGVFYGQSRFGSPYYFLQRQFFFGVLPGLAALWFFARVDYHVGRRFSLPFFIITLVCLVLIFIPGLGNKIYGASRWLQIGAFSFQPSEMAKLSVILYLSAWLARQGHKQVSDFYEGLVPFLVILALLAFLIIKQPDTGTLGLIFFIAFSI